VVTAVWAVGAFVAGVVVVVWSTERLLDGMVGLATLLRTAPFVIAAVFSGLEAENIAVGVVAAGSGNTEIALGTVFGGGSFLVCVALGLAAVFFPLRVRLPRGVLVMVAATPVAGGLALVGGVTHRVAGAVLLLGFAASLTYLARAARRHDFLGADAAEVVAEASPPTRWWKPVGLTVLGLGVLTAGAELVNYGAEHLIQRFSFPAALMGMIITPAAIEAEEVIRQAVPSREGRHDVAAGNLVGTLLYFVLCNLGLIALATPVPVPHHVLVLDWPFLIGVTWLATAFLSRGHVTRTQGVILLVLYAGYVTTHILIRS
jgi:cation:H+ antiporter